METERWLPIPGYEGRYDVSDLGRVRSWLAWRTLPVPHVLAALNSSHGYLSVGLVRDGQATTKEIHALVMLAFSGERLDGLEVRHLDGNSRNNVATNLAYGTRSENTLDKVRHGTHNNTIKTHCPHGHPYDEVNTLYRTGRKVGRVCLTCKRARERGNPF